SLFPYTTLFRSRAERQRQPRRAQGYPDDRLARAALSRRRAPRGPRRPRLPHRRAAQDPPDRAGVSVAHPLGPAPPDRTPRGPAAVRLPDQARADARLRGRELHARGRAADAALLPHRDGDLAPQRDAAAALRGG